MRAEIAAGSTNIVVYLILVTSILIVGITGTLLDRYKDITRPASDLPQSQIRGHSLGTVLSEPW